MKKFLAIFIIAFAVLLGVTTIILAVSDFTGIGKKEEGFKTYTAYSPIPQWLQYINTHKIKCVAEDVETIAFIDMKRGKTFFAYNIDHNNYYVYENIRYTRVPADTVKKYQLKAHFNWTETNGRYIVNTMYAIVIIGGILIWWWTRK